MEFNRGVGRPKEALSYACVYSNVLRLEISIYTENSHLPPKTSNELLKYGQSIKLTHILVYRNPNGFLVYESVVFADIGKGQNSSFVRPEMMVSTYSIMSMGTYRRRVSTTVSVKDIGSWQVSIVEYPDSCAAIFRGKVCLTK